MPLDLPKKEGAATAARTPEVAEKKSLNEAVERLHQKSEFASPVQSILVVIDKSGSMKKYHIATGEYLPAVIERIKHTGQERALDHVYIAVVMIAKDGLKTNGWQKLRDATDVPHEVDGPTPIGKASEFCEEMIKDFVLKKLVAAGVRAKPTLVLVVSDMQARETEEVEVTLAGVEKLVAVVKQVRGMITIVGPTPEETDEDLARKMCGPERKIYYLRDDVAGVITVTLNTITGKEPL